MAEIHMPRAEPHDAPVHHETSDVNIRGIFVFAGGLAVVMALVGVVVWALFQYFAARESRAAAVQYPLASQASRVPPEPRLQINPRQDLSDLLAHEDQTLTTYGWIDKNAGIVRIPIERAMTLTVERGLPTRTIESKR